MVFQAKLNRQTVKCNPVVYIKNMLISTEKKGNTYLHLKLQKEILLQCKNSDGKH